MNEDNVPEFSTKPNERDVVKEDGPHAVLVRLHQNDWNMIKLMLRRDGLSFQRFVALLARAYMDGDPDIIKCIRRYRTLELIPEGEVSRGVFSNRERAEIYAELEKEGT
jgi:lambda repressor-like predicted transcriptional regulator